MIVMIKVLPFYDNRDDTNVIIFVDTNAVINLPQTLPVLSCVVIILIHDDNDKTISIFDNRDETNVTIFVDTNVASH